MHRHRKKGKRRFSFGVLPYSLFGLAIMTGMVFCSSALTFYLLKSMRYSDFFTAASEIVGAVSGGYVCGKYRRRHGAAEGALCGFMIYLFMSAVCILIFGRLKSIKSLLRLVLSGAAGGISGVNSKRPENLRE
ncbi:MAG: TIGR04086 family membrane protein [Oscillospiraceae bacterium]|nr:TIGR04086 family membrane protein [Oscillospiraceae bacterium]